MEIETATFKQIFCRLRKCPEERYEQKALVKLLHRRSRLIGIVLLKLNPQFFRTDMQILREIGTCTNRAYYEDLVLGVRNHYVRERDYGFLRRALKLRLSVGRMLEFGQRVWPEEN